MICEDDVFLISQNQKNNVILIPYINKITSTQKTIFIIKNAVKNVLCVPFNGSNTFFI